MRFVRQGPDIPERLLQAHEEDRVVFFCGAGISYPAGLPGFEGLVGRLFESLAVPRNVVQQAAIKAGQFDTAIGLLEADILGGRNTVRSALAEILAPDLSAPGATASHEALLTLGRTRDGHTRLITTNFDRLFEEVIANNGLRVERFQAPLLPVPKNRWDGVVYLHGLLPLEPTPSALDRLVVSSGDFGLAYLTERWAARFVSELFRKYTVCFVGYSITDPVLRYMMDALAADRLLGESSPEMFAFGGYSKGNEERRANEWRAKNVTPILYRDQRRHTHLHKTLSAWAETYRDGVRGKESIVVESAMARPLRNTKQDYFVDRMLWALSDKDGLPAKRFAELNPTPPLDWLEPLSESRYEHADLPRFGVTPNVTHDDTLKFSVASRPAPYTKAPLMSLVSGGEHTCQWDDVMSHLAHWLTLHLDDPKLVLWLARRGGQLHDDLARLIARRLNELSDLKRAGSEDELDRVRACSPNGIPRPPMRTLWGLLLAGRIRPSTPSMDLLDWRSRFKREGLTTSLRLELRELLTPRVSLHEAVNTDDESPGASEPLRVRNLVGWDIELSTDYVHSSLSNLRADEHWAKALPALLPEFSTLLRDAMDLKRELDEANDQSDRSYIDQPSIGEHPQNRKFRDWTALIDLNRDAWLATSAKSPELARLAADAWWQIPYPVFRRLAFFAAAQDNVLPHRRALDWLLADERWWLWSVETEREAMRLMVALAPQLDRAELAELSQAILDGPPRALFKGNIETDRFTELVERDVWLRLAKIAHTGAVLGAAGAARLGELTAKYPQWRLAEDTRDEFPLRRGNGDEWRTFIVTPRRRRELIEWLKRHPSIDDWQKDDWSRRCRDNFATAACALCALAGAGIWPADRWREALQAWSEEKLVGRSWRHMGPVLAAAPEVLLQSIAHAASYWLKSIAATFTVHEHLFLALANRLLALDHPDGVDTDEPVTRAINHPVGHVTRALLSWWYRKPLDDGQGLPDELKPVFTALCDTRIDKFRHGRVLLATHVIALFRVDRGWAEHYLLPLFDWRSSESEARGAWEGFLWSPRLYRPLMDAIKPAFLDTARHYAALGTSGEQYASLLTFAALDHGDTFSTTELAAATRALPPDGLHEAALALVRGLEGSGDQRGAYWTNRIAPYLHKVWPQSRDHLSPSIAEGLGRLCVAAGDAFPQALTRLRAWLQPTEHPNYLLHCLNEAGHCRQFPEPALDFLALVIGEQTRSSPLDLPACLDAIRTSAPELATNPRFDRLTTHLRQHGRG